MRLLAGMQEVVRVARIAEDGGDIWRHRRNGDRDVQPRVARACCLRSSQYCRYHRQV